MIQTITESVKVVANAAKCDQRGTTPDIIVHIRRIYTAFIVFVYFANLQNVFYNV
jgi:hypothetical protein